MSPSTPLRASPSGLTREELRDVLGLSAIFALRLLGLFLLLPVLSVYAHGLAGATPFLAGLAVGAYGLSQTVLQVPVGILSDRFGRKPVIAAGLLIYAAGCVAAAKSSTIGGLIAGRLIQGSGSIAAVVLAMVADVTRDEVRTRAMAIVGMSIGLSFTLGFIFGPILAAHYGVNSIFWLIACFDLAALAYMAAVIPEPAHHKRSEASLAHVATVLKDRNLAALDLLMFILHVGMTSVFVVTPFFLAAHFLKHDLWKVYGPMILLGGGVMLPAMFWAETRKKLQELLFLGILVAGGGFFLLAAGDQGTAFLVGGLIVYFIGFNLIEPALPSLVSRFAPLSLRGTALGVFNMSQYMGAFCGGAVGGLFLGRHPFWLYPFLILLCIPWAWAASRLDNPRHLRDARFDTKPGSPHHAAELRRHPGVYDAHWLSDGRLELRYSALHHDESTLRALLKDRGLL